MGEIITFYSYKGGVGRTMALANVAVLLAQWGYKILIVDWDLEAPGLEFFFQEYLNMEDVKQREGVIDLLEGISENHVHLSEPLEWQHSVISLTLPESRESLHLFTSGKKEGDYFSKVRNLDLNAFYSEKKGGFFLEALRDEWKKTYDFILIDSRTGITDIGGVCTIQLPDILVLLFTANEQSLRGIIDVSEKALRARQRLPLARLNLVSIPIPAKFDSDEEYEISQKWLDRFSSDLVKLYDDWLPISVNRRQFLEVTKLPYISYFSFGEKLPVREQGTTDPRGLGYAYENLAAIIANHLEPIADLLENRSGFVRAARQRKIEQSTQSDFVTSLGRELIRKILNKEWIAFPNGHEAQLVKVSTETATEDILLSLGLEAPEMIISVVGDMEQLDGNRRDDLARLFDNGIVRVAAEVKSVIIDGDMDNQMTTMLGQAVADQGFTTALLGVRLNNKVTYPGDKIERKSSVISSLIPLDANHSYFVLAEKDARGTRDRLIETLGQKSPVVTVLVGGSEDVEEEILYSVRNGWPIVVIDGSGGLADTIAVQWRKKMSPSLANRFVSRVVEFFPDKDRNQSQRSRSPIAEIIDIGDIYLFTSRSKSEELRQLLRQLIVSQQEKTLKLAWRKFAVYDSNAIRQRRLSARYIVLLLELVVFATLIVLIQTQLKITSNLYILGFSFNQLLHFFVVLFPILISILYAINSRFFSRESVPISLRSCAEAYKQEIFRYRTRTGVYQAGQIDELARKLGSIDQQLVETGVNTISIHSYRGPIPPFTIARDDGFSILNSEQYVDVRLRDSILYFRMKIAQLNRSLLFYNSLVIVLGGLGTLIAALRFDLWIGLIMVIISSIIAYIEYRQIGKYVLQYNMIQIKLENILQWWKSLTEEEQNLQANKDALVDLTETSLQMLEIVNTTISTRLEALTKKRKDEIRSKR